VNRQDGWFAIYPDDYVCLTIPREFGATTYIYIEGPDGRVWRSKPGPANIGFRTFEPPRAYWCVNKGAAAGWPNGSQKASAPVTCPPGSRMVWADALTVGGYAAYTLDIR
jgi:hypothetical protein